jgi:hypothetical protein
VSGDGRLDLDELGDVIDHAAALEGDARAEVLDDGRGLTWGERLESSGVTPWLRRHRVAVGAVAAVAVVAAAGVVAVRVLVPPPVDPELRVSVTPVIPSQFVLDDTVQNFDQIGIFFTQTTLRSAYALSATDPADTARYTILGLAGPGVRASSASLLPSPTGGVENQVARADVDVVPDCFDQDSLSAAVDDYRLGVARTDDRGRTLTGTVPMPPGAPSWSSFLAAVCLQTRAQFGLEAQSVAVSRGPGPYDVRADVTVTSTLPLPATITASPYFGLQSVVASMRPVDLPARSGGVLPLVYEIRDCLTAQLPFIGNPGYPGFQDNSGGAPGAYLSVDFPDDVLPPGDNPLGIAAGIVQAPLVLTADQKRAIEAAMGQVCAGSPTAAVDVVAVGSPRQVIGVFPSGNPQSTRLPVTLTVAARGAQRLTLRSPEPMPEESATVLLAPASTRVADGRATVRTWLDVDCQTGYAPPAVAQLEVTTGRGTFPLQATVDDAALAQAISAGCPELPLQSLLDYGWQNPAG